MNTMKWGKEACGQDGNTIETIKTGTKNTPDKLWSSKCQACQGDLHLYGTKSEAIVNKVNLWIKISLQWQGASIPSCNIWHCSRTLYIWLHSIERRQRKILQSRAFGWFTLIISTCAHFRKVAVADQIQVW